MARNIRTIDSDRLFLRGIDETDAVFIVNWRSDPGIYRYFKSPHQIRIEEHLNWYQNRYLQDRNCFNWIGIEKECGKRVGVFGLKRIGDKAEISYLLAQEAQHRGFAAEAVRRLIDYAETEWKCRKIIAEIHEDNLPSLRLVEKLGFCRKEYNRPFITYETGAAAK